MYTYIYTSHLYIAFSSTTSHCLLLFIYQYFLGKVMLIDALIVSQ